MQSSLWAGRLCWPAAQGTGTGVDLSWPGAACSPCAGGSPPLPPRLSGGITIKKFWLFYIRNHAFWCIFA